MSHEETATYLLEDPDGAPYPEPVQQFWRTLCEQLDDGLQLQLVAALESVALPDEEKLTASILAATWPNGDNLDGVTRITAGMIATRIWADAVEGRDA